jgi:Ser/Thr protein kinase RdoA (MazF antagonist)
LRRAGAARDLIGELFDRTWSNPDQQRGLPGAVRELAGRLVGQVETAALAWSTAGPLTLCHGDASLPNVFTSSSGEIALVDWEDVTCAPGVGDLAWLLVSSVQANRWDDVIRAYGEAPRLSTCFRTLRHKDSCHLRVRPTAAQVSGTGSTDWSPRAADFTADTRARTADPRASLASSRSGSLCAAHGRDETPGRLVVLEVERWTVQRARSR